MTTVNVCVCDFNAGNKISRLHIQVGSMTGKMDSLFSDIANHVGSTDFEIFYCGQKLETDMVLDTVNLSTQSTLFVFCKSPSPQKDPANSMSVGAHVHFIQKAVQNPNYRKTIDQIMTDAGSLRKLLSAVPGLGEDPMILSMLQDPELLQILAHPENIFKVCREHPLFEEAAFHVAGIVSEENARDSTRVRGNVYSLDQMSDEEDEGGSERGATASASQQQQPQQAITASQLAAALASARAPAHPSTSASSTGTSAPAQRRHGTQSSSSGSATSLISNDFFQQAMMSAQSSALEAQLQQLRDMGFTDDNAARQALNATGGDLQAALDLIFGDNPR